MATMIKAHGYAFWLESDGFSHNEKDRDRGYDAVETALKAMTPEEVAALHAAGLAWIERGEGEQPEGIGKLEYLGYRAATEGWESPGDQAIMITPAA